MNSFYLILGLSLGFFFSCRESPRQTADQMIAPSTVDTSMFKEVTDLYGTFGIAVLGTMTQDSMLNPQADLAYADTKNESYLLVFKEPKDRVLSSYGHLFDSSKNTLDNYVAIKLNSLKAQTNITHQLEKKSYTLHNLPAKELNLFIKLQDPEPSLYYKMTFIESSECFYFISCWTLENRKSSYEKYFDYMVRSFYEISPQTDD